jgi:hypothetical protein
MKMQSCFILLGLLGACGDDSTGVDGGVTRDSGRPIDAGGPRDAATPRDSGRDSAVQSDAAMADAGIDAGRLDGGTDAGIADAGFDGGSDAGPPPDAGAPPDAASLMYTFASPLQVDLSSIFTVDTVAITAAAGRTFPPLSTMDGSGYVYFTRSAGATAGDAAGGLPDDGFFASNADHPDVQLAFNDTSTAPNSIILHEPGGPTSVTFPIVAVPFATVQLYLTSTEGSAPTEVTLSYGDGTSSTTTFTVPDWFASFTAAAPVFVVTSGLSRYSAGGFDFSHGAALFGVRLTADPTKTLMSVTVSVSSGGRLALYGATAYR